MGRLQIIHSSSGVLNSNVRIGVAALIAYTQQNFGSALIVMYVVLKNLENARRRKLLIRRGSCNDEVLARIIDKGSNGFDIVLDGILLARRLGIPIRRDG